MKKISKISHLVIAFIFAITYLLPGGMCVFATTTGSPSPSPTPPPKVQSSVNISSMKQIGSNLSEGESFGLDISLTSPVKTATVSISGAASKGGSYSAEVYGGSEVSVMGLKYTGKGRSITATVNYVLEGGDAGTTNSETIELDATTTEEGTGALSLVDSSVIAIKAGEAQKVSIKVRNNGGSNVKNSNVKITMVEPVEGIDLKDNFTQIAMLGPHETKTVNFNVSTTKNVKQGKYKLNVDVNGTSQTLYLKVESNFTPPLMELRLAGNKTFKVNTTEDITVYVKNVGDTAAKNVKVEIVNNENVAIVSGSNVKYISNIGAHSEGQMPAKIRINKATTGTVPLQVNLTYLDDAGEEKKDAQYVYLNTDGAAVNTEVTIVDIKGPTGTYGVDNNFEVSFAVAAKKGAKNIKISVAGDTGIVPKTQNLFMIDKLEAGQKKQFKVTLAATKAAANSSHPIEIKAEYKNNEEAIVFSQFTSANITNPEAEENGEGDKTPKGLPKVIIGEYKSNPVVVKAGEEFDLDLGFLNTNSTKSVHNLKANLTVKEVGEKDTGSVFTPVGASNTFFIADLAPRQTGVKKIRLYTIPSAKPKTYEITIEMEYEDDKGNPIKATENIGIPVEQVTKLEIADIQTDSGAQVGMPMSLTANIYNTGKTDISNVSIHIEGEGFEIQENKMFIGNFEKGASEQYMPTLIANQTGELTGKIIIEYEDPTGSMQKVSQDFNVEVMEMPPMPDGGENSEMPPIPEEKPAKWPTIVGIIGGFGLAALIAFGVVKKRNAKLAEKAFDEE
ncbi:MAG: COG1361 S-layer family protein [Cellulosilyticaceae bacterium]